MGQIPDIYSSVFQPQIPSVIASFIYRDWENESFVPVFLRRGRKGGEGYREVGEVG